MLQRLFGDKIFHSIVLFLYAVMVVFMPINKPVISITIVVIAVFTFLGHSWQHLRDTFRKKKHFFWIVLFFSWSLISFFWTKDIEQGLKFINLILPFYLFIFALSIHPIRTEKEGQFLLILFITSVTLSAMVNAYFFLTTDHPVDYDRRDMSLFTSHIRLSLMAVLSILFSCYLLIKSTFKGRFIFLIPIAFLIYYTYLSEVVSGIIAFGVLGIGGALYGILRLCRSKVQFYLTTGILFVVLCIAGTVFYTNFKKQPAFEVLEFTAQGNPYISETHKIMYENGTPISLNICFEELESEWPKRSNLDLQAESSDGITYEWNLIRYLASKGLNKDAAGVQALTEEDIQNIENGYVSILDKRSDLTARYIRIKDEFTSTGMNPNGFSLLQRINYWRTGFEIFKENSLIGVGIGDSRQVFQEFYNRDDSSLNQENRRTSHQQFLSIAVATGAIGLLLFILFLISSFKASRSSVMGLISMAIITVSFLNEDTIESLVGAVLCAFVFGLFSNHSFHASQQEEGLSDQNQ